MADDHAEGDGLHTKDEPRNDLHASAHITHAKAVRAQARTLCTLWEQRASLGSREARV